jgi:diguanylate cyclase (GGDEF)-like protein
MPGADAHTGQDSRAPRPVFSWCVRPDRVAASSCVPLTVGGEVIGSVLLSRAAPYSEAEEQQIRESVGQAAPVLANLRNLAVAEFRAATDGLTGLPNKRAVNDALKRAFAQATATATPLALLLLDLDFFKQVNDQHGHAVGDQVLAGVGTALRGALRSGDFAGRNGGEEFAVMLPDTEVAAALEIAERVRAAIAEVSFPGPKCPECELCHNDSSSFRSPARHVSGIVVGHQQPTCAKVNRDRRTQACQAPKPGTARHRTCPPHRPAHQPGSSGPGTASPRPCRASRPRRPR